VSQKRKGHDKIPDVELGIFETRRCQTEFEHFVRVVRSHLRSQTTNESDEDPRISILEMQHHFRTLCWSAL